MGYRGTVTTVCFLVISCGSNPGGEPAVTSAFEETTSAATTSTTASESAAPGAVTSSSAVRYQDPLTNPTFYDTIAVAEDGRELALICWGEGNPAVVLEAGHPSAGIQQFGHYGAAFVRELVPQTTVCAYDRAGYGLSDPAPNEPRDADDVISDLHTLLMTAEIDVPYLLVGASFGGMIVTYYAARYPDEVAAVVLLDAPVPSATLSLTEAPELAWDHSSNPEHLDIVPEFEHRFARERLPFGAPLTVITASRGGSTVEDQSIWLELSPQASQVELEGGHNIYNNDAEGVVAEIIKLLEAARG